jgi:TPR repeat protein
MKDTPEEIFEKGSLKEVEELMKKPFSLVNQLCPLHYATANKDIKVVIYLLDKCGVDPNHCSDDATTPLHQAARYDNVEAISVLMSRGANPEAKDELGGFDFIGILKGRGKFDLSLIAKKIILAEKSNAKACYELANLYLHGNPKIRVNKSLDMAKHYVVKGLQDKQSERKVFDELKNLEKEIDRLKKECEPKKSVSEPASSFWDFFEGFSKKLSSSKSSQKEDEQSLLGKTLKKNQ